MKRFPIEQNRDLGEKPELSDMKVLFFVMAFLFFTNIVMPQYFGIHLGYDITCPRLAAMVLTVYFLFVRKGFMHLGYTWSKCKIWIPMTLYLIVTGYTMVLRVDINSFMMPFMEILVFFFLLYGIRFVIGYKRAIRWMNGCSYFLGFYGLVEYALGSSPMLKLLKTLPSSVSNTYRSGHYRIMGPCQHPLGFGLLLIVLLAIASIDLKRNRVYLFQRPVLFLVLFLDIFLTGSRSTLGIAIGECIVIVLLSRREERKRTVFFFLVGIVALGLFLLVFYKTDVGNYILLQITSLIDEAFGTELAVKFGAEVQRLDDSAEYRHALLLVFTLDWLNPLVGRGVSRGFSAEIGGYFVYSIDNYYIMQYIKYAYPGMISYVAIIIYAVVKMIKSIVESKSAICKMCLVATLAYFINLWWLDALMTLKFIYVIFAIFFSCIMVMNIENKENIGDELNA